MLRRGVKGRTIDDHPVCAKCAFDLIGVYPASSECPECGSRLTANEAGRSAGVRIGNRVKRPRLIWPGIGMIALALAIGAVVMIGSASGWRTHAPTWYLRMELGRAAGDEAMKELLARQAAASLSPSQTSAIVEAALARQGDPTLPWSTSWGDFVENGWTLGFLNPEQVSRYIRQGAPLSFKGRPKIEEGGKWPYRLHLGSGRCGTATMVYLESRVTSIRLGDREIASPGGRMVSGVSARGTASTGSMVDLKDVPTGTYTVRATWTLAGSRTRNFSAPDAIWEQTFETALEIVPPGSDAVELVTDPALRAGVIGSISVKQMELNAGAAQGYVELQGTPTGVAFDVFWRLNDGAAPREFKVGSVTSPAPVPHGSWGINGALPLGIAPTTVDVVLRPSADRARETPDITQIWGEEVVIPAVPVNVVRPIPPEETPPQPPDKRRAEGAGPR